MAQNYLGSLPKHDPLHGYLSYDILPQVSDRVRRPEFRVFGLNCTNNQVYLYEEKHTRAKIIGKFFIDGPHQSVDKASKRARREYHNLVKLRNHGFSANPQQVIKPLAYNANLNHLLVEEYVQGEDLGKILHKALYENQSALLYSKLTLLAHFLASMHNRTAIGERVNFNQDCHYFTQLVGQLKCNKGLSSWDADELYSLCHQWRESPQMWYDQQVLVHGDATPVNFIFGNEHEVTAIDLERMKYADRTFDVGRIVGEIQHYFLNAKRRKSDAEPFIGHFLWEYARHFPDHSRTFEAITARLPFQLAITLMRIARNPWITPGHSHYLIKEAKKTLRGAYGNS